MIEAAKKLVREYVVRHLSEEETATLREIPVYVVWSCKTLQNWKFLLYSPSMDNLYFEITYNGDKSEFYIDVYAKKKNYAVSYFSI